MAQSNEPTTEAMDLAIAEFMELETDNEPHLAHRRTVYLVNGYWFPLRKLKYHTSWDWLRPVWERFRDLNFRHNPPRRWNHENHKERIVNCLINGTVGECHEALYNGINWYQKVNQQKQDNEK